MTIEKPGEVTYAEDSHQIKIAINLCPNRTTNLKLIDGKRIQSVSCLVILLFSTILLVLPQNKI